MERSPQSDPLEKLSPPFSQKLADAGQYPITTTTLEILQLNVSRKCNLACKHCHVQAGPERKELMTKEIFDRCLEIIKDPSVSTLDITGGAPETNPNLEWFIPEAVRHVSRLIVRSNLVILKEERFKHFIDLYTDNNVEICASLPHVQEDRTDRQRGHGSFRDALAIMGELNRRGYGRAGSGRILDLVHNPVGAYLPGDQKTLENEYKQKLYEKYNIRFNTLFCITNIPMGRYLDYLLQSGNYEDYMTELVAGFNPGAAKNVMCKNTLSVSWDGLLYNCDFNQMISLPGQFGDINHILEFEAADFANKEIALKNHCYGCTAGQGSSCGGSLDPD